ncbi:hypothetical protein, partial [Cupriavidus sp. SS-3]|uniref:hypothetical protein n=1 Tax=Cupriavidus sp. SS-3 TaxID=3109596 RepID=UPI002DB654F9
LALPSDRGSDLRIGCSLTIWDVVKVSRSVDETLQYQTRYRVVIVSTKMYLSDRKMTWNTAQMRELNL